jgi:molybdenum cofactor cytidylyltransferase
MRGAVWPLFDSLRRGKIESVIVSISIIVLAAGASRRMGTPKPLVKFDTETCLSLVLKACLQSLADEVVLVIGAEAEAVRAEAIATVTKTPAKTFEVVLNERFERGQTSSLKTGLEGSSPRSDAFVIFPVDHPLVTAVEIDALIHRFSAHPRGRTIFVAAHAGVRGHPVLCSATHRAAMLGLEDDEPLHNYIRLHEGETEQVPVDNPGVVSGMNTPEEYKNLLEIYRRSRAGPASSDKAGNTGKKGSDGRRGGRIP